MTPSHKNAPPPDLRIIPTLNAIAHEQHDDQRSAPLIERMKDADTIINPPIVAPIDDHRYVILDGANRCYTFQQLEIPHILVQAVSYESEFVDLDTWHHIISGIDTQTLIKAFKQLTAISLVEAHTENAIAWLQMRDGAHYSLHANAPTLHEKNARLRDFVHSYQSRARLYRTALNTPEDIWSLYPEAAAIVTFPTFQPVDIILAAQEGAFLPPGISRHIIHGRALRVNYPMAPLRDPDTPLEAKNDALQSWIQQKLAQRHIRYYAEAVYQFDE